MNKKIKIGDKNHTKNDDQEIWCDLTIKEYFEKYIFSEKEIEKMRESKVIIHDCIMNSFERVWDLKVIEGMTILIESDYF